MKKTDFSISEFSKRLTEIAKKDFGSATNLGETAGLPNILIYTQKAAREPRARILFKLASVGVDVEYLLTGKKRMSEKEINDEVMRLKSKIFDLMEYIEQMKKSKE